MSVIKIPLKKLSELSSPDPGTVFIFADADNAGKLTMKGSGNDVYDLTRMGEGASDLTNIYNNNDYSQTDSFNEIIENINWTNENNANSIYPQWVDYTHVESKMDETIYGSTTGTTYNIKFKLKPQVRINSEQVHIDGMVLLKNVYTIEESKLNPGYIESISFEGWCGETGAFDEEGRSMLQYKQGKVAKEVYELYYSAGIETIKSENMAFYGVCGNIHILNFKNPNLFGKEEILKLKEDILKCEDEVGKLKDQISQLKAESSETVSKSNEEADSLQNEIASKQAELEDKKNEVENPEISEEDLSKLKSEIELIESQLIDLNVALSNNQSELAGLIKSFDEESNNLGVMLDEKEKHCDQLKSELAGLENQNPNSITHAIIAKEDMDSSVNLPKIEKLYLSNEGNRIKGIEPGTEASSLEFYDPNGTKWNPKSANGGDLNNADDIVLENESESLNKLNFKAGIWEIKVLSDSGSETTKASKIITFPTDSSTLDSNIKQSKFAEQVEVDKIVKPGPGES
jgi:hypothetical protein